MKNLMLKELRLSTHPMVYMWLILITLILIPSYPYVVAFGYVFISFVFIFTGDKENNDALFTAMLPVAKKEVVLARFFTVVGIEMLSLLLALPFAWLSTRLNPAGNPVGLDANASLFGVALVMYAIYNVIFIPGYYKTAWKIAIPNTIAIGLSSIFAVVAEVVVSVVPAAARFDGCAPETIGFRLAALATGAVIFVGLTFIAERRAAANFEKVDL